jgi:hypothetical protein
VRKGANPDWGVVGMCAAGGTDTVIDAEGDGGTTTASYAWMGLAVVVLAIEDLERNQPVSAGGACCSRWWQWGRGLRWCSRGLRNG